MTDHRWGLKRRLCLFFPAVSSRIKNKFLPTKLLFSLHSIFHSTGLLGHVTSTLPLFPNIMKSFLSPSESQITSVQLAALPAFQCGESDVILL